MIKKVCVYLIFIFLFIWVSPLFSGVVAQGNCVPGSPIYPGCLSKQAPQANTQLGCGGGFGPFADVFCKGSFDLGSILNTFLSGILGFLTAISALYFFFQLVTAGIGWIGAGGDKNSIEAARNKIINAILGLIVVAAAWVIVGILGSFVGLNILNAGEMLKNLRLGQ